MLVVVIILLSIALLGGGVWWKLRNPKDDDGTTIATADGASGSVESTTTTPPTVETDLYRFRLTYYNDNDDDGFLGPPIKVVTNFGEFSEITTGGSYDIELATNAVNHLKFVLPDEGGYVFDQSVRPHLYYGSLANPNQTLQFEGDRTYKGIVDTSLPGDKYVEFQTKLRDVNDPYDSIIVDHDIVGYDTGPPSKYNVTPLECSDYCKVDDECKAFVAVPKEYPHEYRGVDVSGIEGGGGLCFKKTTKDSNLMSSKAGLSIVLRANGDDDDDL